ncbi:MAG: hybrid sensor histidine kinase/response regulator [Chloroflexota bacterium]
MSFNLPDEYILIVDDVPSHLDQLKLVLELHGYQVKAVDNGVNAIHSAIEHPPDIILLDVNMPDFDGYEVCLFLKNYESTEDIPIIFISGLNSVEDKLRAFANGGIDFITKPFHIDDVIARINTHLEIQRLKKELAYQVAELKEFAATVAHDIKGPMSLIYGFSDELHRNWSAYQQSDKRKMIKKIRNHSLKTTNIVDEILKLALITQEEIKMDMISMEEVIEEVQHRIEPAIMNYGGEITFAEEWPNALGHAPWIEEVWVNYITNALKYGGEPAIVTAGYTCLPNGMIKYWVKDQGPGLTPDQQNQVFLQFKRLSQAKNKEKGHGLGLTIVKRIIDKLMGEVGVESNIGEGSTFFFTLRQP